MNSTIYKIYLLPCLQADVFARVSAISIWIFVKRISNYLQYSILSLMSYSYLINLIPTLILILISRNSRFEHSLRFLDKNIQHDFSYLFPTRNFDVGQNYVVQTQCAVKIDTFGSQVSDAVDKWSQKTKFTSQFDVDTINSIGRELTRYL